MTRSTRIGLALALMSAASLTVQISPSVVTAQALDPEVAKALRVEWERAPQPWRQPTIEGYVYNNSLYRIGSVRLRIESLNASNQVVGETLAWVYGNIAARDRWYFSAPLPKIGETFRVTVESFNLIAREAPRESP